jgi:hypothetical protein
MSEKKTYDWESCEHNHRSARGRTQEKWVYHPCEYNNVEYVMWEDMCGGESVDIPNGSVVFREHGFEPIAKARLSIAGSIDFVCGVGELDLTIDIDQRDCEEAYLKELLRMLKLAKAVIKDRRAYLKQKEADAATPPP